MSREYPIAFHEENFVLTPFELAAFRAASFVQNLESSVSLEAFIAAIEDSSEVEDEKDLETAWAFLLKNSLSYVQRFSP
jgi:hypothetical protein